MGITTTVSS